MIKNTFDIVRTLLPPNSSSVPFSGWQHQLPSYSEPKDRHPLSYSDLDTQFTMGYIQIIAHSYQARLLLMFFIYKQCGSV